MTSLGTLKLVMVGVSHHENEQMVQINVLFICFQDQIVNHLSAGGCSEAKMKTNVKCFNETKKCFPIFTRCHFILLKPINSFPFLSV